MEQNEILTLAEAVNRVADAILTMSTTLFNTLGSAKSGNALDGLAELPTVIEGLADAIAEVGR